MNVSTDAPMPSESRRRAGRRFSRLATFLVLASILSGCGKFGGGESSSDDPEINARLDGLTRELHHTMVGRKLNRDFDEFVAINKLEVPPPPVGKKYAINEKWKVILVNK